MSAAKAAAVLWIESDLGGAFYISFSFRKSLTVRTEFA